MTQDQVAGRTVNRTPTSDARENPQARKTNYPSRKLQLHELLRLGNSSDADLDRAADVLMNLRFHPTGTEGFAKAEVTAGGISTGALSSRTMETKTVPGLYVIGEAVDVTGWLGGYNFQWAWSSGWAAGKAISGRRDR